TRNHRAIRIRQFDPDTRGARVAVHLRIDDRNLAGELAIRKAARLQNDRLSDRDDAEVALRDVHHRPDDGRVGNPEQDVPGLRAHSLDGIALENDTVTRGRPID